MVVSLLFPNIMHTLVYFVSSWLGLNYPHCTCLLVLLCQMPSNATAGMDLYNCLPIVGPVCTAVPGASLLRTAETRVFVWRTHCRKKERITDSKVTDYGRQMKSLGRSRGWVAEKCPKAYSQSGVCRQHRHRARFCLQLAK